MGGQTPQAGIPQNTNPAKPPNVVQEQPPLYMSLEEINKVPDPAVRAALSMGHALRESAFNTAKERRMAKIDALLRRAPLHKREALKAQILKQVAGAQLSLGADGAVRDDAAEWLDAFSALIDSIPDTPGMLQGGGVITPQPHPVEYGGEMSEERRQQVFNEYQKNTRIAGDPLGKKAG